MVFNCTAFIYSFSKNLLRSHCKQHNPKLVCVVLLYYYLSKVVNLGTFCGPCMWRIGGTLDSTSLQNISSFLSFIWEIYLTSATSKLQEVRNPI